MPQASTGRRQVAGEARAKARPIRGPRAPDLPPAARVPPHNLEAEESVLGSMMLSAEAIADVVALVRPEDFYRSAHREIFETLRALYARGDPVDSITAVDELKCHGVLDDVGGPLYVQELVEGVGVPSAARTHARIVREAAERRRLIAVAGEAMEGAFGFEDVDALLRRFTEAGAAAAADHPHPAQDGAAFVFDGPAEEPALWGSGSDVLWVPGEPLLVVGPEGVGKTTVTQQLILRRTGIRPPELLGFPVVYSEQPVLYVAADRPQQARRSLRRMVTENDRETLREKLRVWRGPLPFDVAERPESLAEWVVSMGAGTVVLDALGAIFVDLARDETGSRVNRALGHTVAAGVEVVAIHHTRKATPDNPKPKKLDDSYGSRWLTAGSGSVVVLWGNPGDPVVELVHRKQPAETVGPLTLAFDHEHGEVEVHDRPDPLGALRSAPRGLTAKAAAQVLFGDDGKANEVKARRKLDALVQGGLADRLKGETVSGAVTAPDAYFATPPKGTQEVLQ